MPENPGAKISRQMPKEKESNQLIPSFVFYLRQGASRKSFCPVAELVDLG
jgi:hypothetical protein